MGNMHTEQLLHRDESKHERPPNGLLSGERVWYYEHAQTRVVIQGEGVKPMN